MTEDRWEIFGDYDEDRKFNEGVKFERDRIIALLKTYVEAECDEYCEWSCECFAKYEANHFIALIKGETE